MTRERDDLSAVLAGAAAVVAKAAENCRRCLAIDPTDEGLDAIIAKIDAVEAALTAAQEKP